MKNKILFALSVLPFFSQAFTQEEWTGLIETTVNVKDDLTWDYNTEKLKSYSPLIKPSDINELKLLAKNDDLQIAQASKYLLSFQGEKTNDFLIDNYLEDVDVNNGLYYLNLNFINTADKKEFWQYLKRKESIEVSKMIDGFEECNSFKNANELGGHNVILNSYDEFFEKKSLIENYTHVDLMFFEMDLMDVEEYPITVTFFPNKHVINSKENEKCLKTQDNQSYVYSQKIGAIYKQHKKIEELKSFCDSISGNEFLKTKFNYLCI